MLIFISSVKLIAEIALLALLGQGILGLLAGQKKQQNVFYQLLAQVGKPFVTVARVLSPSFVLERHVPLVAFLILVFVWVGATAAKIHHCVQIGVALCR